MIDPARFITGSSKHNPMSAHQRQYNPLIRQQLSKDTPFAWFLFDQAKHNSRYDFNDFQAQARSLEACLAALGLALDEGESVDAWLDLQDWGSLFVLTTLGLRHAQPEMIDTALDNLNDQQETHPRELLDACLWDGQKDISPCLNKLYRHESPIARQVWIALARARQQTPIGGQLMELDDIDHPGVRAELLHWLGEQRAAVQPRYLQQYYTHDNPRIAYAASRAGLLQGDPKAKAALARLARRNNPHLLDAIELIVASATDPDQNRQLIDRLWQSDAIALRAKLHAIAVAGLPETVDRLFQPMVDKETSRAAGEAFTTLTGVDIEYENLDAPDAGCEACDDEDSEATETPSLGERRKNDPFISDWEDDLPYPCPDATHNWWQQNRGRFNDGTHYLAGLETSRENLNTVLLQGNQRQRQLAALHLSFKYQAPHLDCGWPLAWQKSRRTGDND